MTGYHEDSNLLCKRYRGNNALGALTGGVALLGAMLAGCGGDENMNDVDAAPQVDAGVQPDAGAAVLPADWDAPIGLPVAEDINADPDIVEIELVAAETEVELSPGVTTSMYTYNGTFPGPLIEAKVGDRLIVHFTNDLPEETTVHWHGVELPAIMDGSNIAQAPVAADGGTFTYEFELLTAATYWYHPHVRSNEQVEKGLYGALVVRDPAQDDALGLPANEVTVVLDDILLDGSGQVAPPFPADPVANATMQLNGREGNVLLVNGRSAQAIDVASGVPLRVRLINTANTRFFRLSVPGHTIHRIGGDGGLISKPEAIEPIDMVPDPEDASAMISDPDADSGLLLVPGERADVVFTPTGDAGEELALEWHDVPRGDHVVADVDGTLTLGHDHTDGKQPPEALLRMRFVPGSVAGAQAYEPPVALRTIEAIDATGAAPLPVTFGHTPPDAEGNVIFFATVIDGAGVPFGNLSTDQALQAELGEVRIWEVTNMTGGDHPFHPHGFFFQHIETEYIDLDDPDNNAVVPAASVENKDTIRVPARPGALGRSRTVVRLAVHFDDTGREGTALAGGKIPAADASGGWIAHCHILEHADRGMMTFLNLTAPAQ